MRTLGWILILILVAVLGALAWLIWAPLPEKPGTDATNGTSTSTNGTSTATGALRDRVDISAPQSGQTVFRTFAVTGEAPGPWFFEASFPIRVVDVEGNTLATGIATALSEWMTTDQVPFAADIEISAEYSGPATLVLMRDNPSGLPENDDSVSVPITIQYQ